MSQRGLLIAFTLACIALGSRLNPYQNEELSLILYGIAGLALLVVLWDMFRPRKILVKTYEFKDQMGKLKLEIGVTEEGQFTGAASPNAEHGSIIRQASIRPNGTTDYIVFDKDTTPKDLPQ